MIIKPASPFENLKELIKYFGSLTGTVGINCTEPNYRLNAKAIVIFFFIVVYYFSTTWLVIETIQVDWKSTLDIISPLGIVVLVSTILMNAKIYSNDLYYLQTLIVRLYKEYEKRDRSYVTALNGCCVQVKVFMKWTALLYSSLAFILTSLPIVVWTLTGRHELILPYYIPGLNTETLTGYLITLSVQLISSYIAALVFYVGDSFLIFYFVQINSLCEIFRLKVKDFNDLIEIQQNGREPNIDTSLIDIVLWHKLYLKYLGICNRMFYKQISIQIFCCLFSILIALYLVLTSEWTGTYPLLIVSYVKLNMCFLLGTTLERCSEEMEYEIYNISWYNLSVPQQKVVRRMLMQSQQPNQMMLAGVLPLSVASALQITKVLYSTFMMMVEFIKK